MKINSIYKKIFLVVLVPISILSICYLMYEKNILPGFKRELPYCLMLRSGTAGVKVHYSDAFYLEELVYGTTSSQIRIYKNENDTSDYGNILGIETSQLSGIFSSTDSFVSGMQSASGPHYSKATLNGYDVAKAESKFIDGSPMTEFEIPVGDHIISVHYYTAKLSSTESVLADKILKNIEFVQSKRKVSGEKIEGCREFGNFFFD